MKLLILLANIILIFCIAFFLSSSLRDRVLRRSVNEKLAEINQEVSHDPVTGGMTDPDAVKPESYPIAGGESLVLDEQAFNAFIKNHYQQEIPPEITNWAVELHEETGTVYLMVDLNEFMRSIEEEASRAVSRMVEDGIGFMIKGKLTGEKGIGVFKIEKVKLGAIPMPLSLISRVAKKEIRKQGETPLEDIFSLAFELPEGFQSLSIQNQRVILSK